MYNSDQLSLNADFMWEHLDTVENPWSAQNEIFLLIVLKMKFPGAGFLKDAIAS